MNIFENPFYILGVSPADNRRKIAAASEDKAFLLGDSKVVDEARNALLIPEKRLAAEIRWFLGVENKDIAEIIEYLKALNVGNKPEPIDFYSNIDLFYDTSSLNFLVYMLCLRKFQNEGDYIKDTIFKINDHFENMDIEEVLDLINNARGESGFPFIEDWVLEDEFKKYRSDIVKIIDDKLLTFQQKEYIKIIEKIAEEYAREYDEDDEEYYYNYYILGDLLDSYELNIISSVDEQTDLVLSALGKMRNNVNNISQDDFEMLSSELEIWHDMIKPLVLTAKRREIENKNIDSQFNKILNTFGDCDTEFANVMQQNSVNFQTKHNIIDNALKLTRLLKDYLGDISHDVSDFADAHIEELEELRDKFAEILKKQRERDWTISQLNNLKNTIINEMKKFHQTIALLRLNLQKWRLLSAIFISQSNTNVKENSILSEQGCEILNAARKFISEFLNKTDMRRKEQIKYVLSLMYLLNEYLTVFSAFISNSIEQDIKNLEAIKNNIEKQEQYRQSRFIDFCVGICILILLFWFIYSNVNNPVRRSSNNRNSTSSSYSQFSSSLSSKQARQKRRNELDAQLKILKRQIDRTKTELNNMKNELDIIQHNLTMDMARYDLSHEELYRSRYNDEVNNYNDYATKYNSLLEKQKSDIKRYNNMVDEYNSLR